MPTNSWWETEQRPGYLGQDRNKIQAGWDERYGKGKWRIAWEWGNITLEKPEALQIYEDGYYEFLRAHPETLDWLVNSASNVYDTALSNVEAGFSYDIQETPSNHIHDVAIRRAVMRLGTWFKGKELLEVRNPQGPGNILNPHRVPFHLPQMIYRGPIQYKGQERDFSANPPWWINLGVPDSIESFYQHNKVLQQLCSANWSSD